MRPPEVLWAQRADKVYLTVALPDAKDVSVTCEPEGKFSFSAKSVHGESVGFSIELFGMIIPEVGLFDLFLSLLWFLFLVSQYLRM